jgi:CRP/FNR family transcriptional regulator, cyclic AMP receptor protein
MLATAFNLTPLLSSIGHNKTPVLFRKKQVIFSHGDSSDAIFYVEKGTVKLTLASASGKEAFIGLHDAGDFFGESCLAPEKPTRFHTATAVTDMQVLKVDRAAMIRILRTNAEFAYGFISHLLKRNQQIQEDLVNNLLSSSEERLAQVLSSLNRSARSGGKLVPRLSQQDLANMVGITRQRTNVLIKRLRKQVRRPADS